MDWVIIKYLMNHYNLNQKDAIDIYSIVKYKEVVKNAIIEEYQKKRHD